MIPIGVPITLAEDAACGQVGPDLFFPEKGGSVREAKLVCSSCPVIDECRTWAIDNDERFGVWGGLSELDRRRLRHQRNNAAA